MKKLLPISFLLLSLHAFSATYYINFNAGNDANTGLATGAAWLTLANPNNASKYADGDTLLFARGAVFYGALIPQHNHLVIDAYGTGANPIITGFTTVSSWTNLGGNIWESTSAASTLSTCNMVVINGVNTPMGRYPNNSYLLSSAATSTSITNASLNAGTLDWTGAEAVVRSVNWELERLPITSASGSTINYSAGTVYTPTAGMGFFIQNDSRTLDSANEWYYNPSTKKLRIYSTVSPTNVQLTTVDTLVYINANYVSFNNISFTGSNTATAQVTFSSHPKFINCSFDFAGYNAIITRGGSCDSTNISNCTINHTNNNAIDLGSGSSTHNLVYNNTITNIGLTQGAGDGNGADRGYTAMQFSGAETTAYNNTIDTVGYIGIYFLGDSILIHDNIIKHFNRTVDDGGGIYTWRGPNPQNFGIKLYNNVITDAPATTAIAGSADTVGLSHGIYLDDSTANIEGYNNTCSGMGYSGIYFYSGTKNNNFHDNNLYDNGYTQFFMIDHFGGGSKTINNTFTNNKCVAKTASEFCFVLDIKNDLATFSSTMGTFNNNYYARPIDDSLTFYLQLSNYTSFLHKTLAYWQANSGEDASSKKSPKVISDTSQIRFISNSTGSNQTTPLGATYEDLAGVNYTSVTVAPYSSITLLYLAALPVQNNILKITLGSKIIFK